jgi:hypothetical protein
MVLLLPARRWKIHCLMRAEYRQAAALAEEMLVLGEGRRGVGERAEGHRALGISLMFPELGSKRTKPLRNN